MSSTKVYLDIDNCCERFLFLSNSLTQARNLGLNYDYLQALESLIKTLMPLIQQQDEAAIIAAYDAAIANILVLRTDAFELFKDELIDKYTPVPPTPPPSN
jgi:hypothetical protein